MSNNDQMTKTERDELRRLANERARIAIKKIDHRKAEILADFERKAAAEYSIADEAWADVTAAAVAAVKAADEVIAEKCREAGIPDEWRPRIGLGWSGRGSNAVKERMAELRRVATRNLDAAGQKAKVKIEENALQVREQLTMQALESAEARAFVEAMPTVEQLIPPLEVPKLETGATKIRDLRAIDSGEAS
jgi:hypothetical protein